MPAQHLKRIIGVVKAYTTRVGRGPFPTELDDGPDGIGERIRKIGREYGTVTGRPRRCGWFDAVAVRYTAALAGADELAVMLLDVLSGLPELKICTAYELDGERSNALPQRRVRAGAVQAGVRDAAGLERRHHEGAEARPTCRPRRGATSIASANWSGCRWRSSRSARTASRRSVVSEEVDRLGEGSQHILTDQHPVTIFCDPV